MGPPRRSYAPDDRLRKLYAEVERLRALRAQNDRDWARLPRGGLLVLGVVPTYYLFGGLMAFAYLGLFLSLASIAMFLVGGRTRIYTEDIRDLRQEIRRLGADPDVPPDGPEDAA